MTVNAINLERAQIAQAVEILSNAFHSDPMFFYIMPSEEARRNITKFIPQFSNAISSFLAYLAHLAVNNYFFLN